MLIQAYDPDLDWSAAVGRMTDAGGVAITLLRADQTGNRLVGTVAYETGGDRWEQQFAATLLDEDGLRAALDVAGLQFERWIDQAAGWLVARPAL